MWSTSTPGSKTTFSNQIFLFSPKPDKFQSELQVEKNQPSFSEQKWKECDIDFHNMNEPSIYVGCWSVVSPWKQLKNETFAIKSLSLYPCQWGFLGKFFKICFRNQRWGCTPLPPTSEICSSFLGSSLMIFFCWISISSRALWQVAVKHNRFAASLFLEL